jgi:hypothetical protein
MAKLLCCKEVDGRRLSEDECGGKSRLRKFEGEVGGLGGVQR